MVSLESDDNIAMDYINISNDKELVVMWDFHKNKEDPSKIRKNDKRKFWWKCLSGHIIFVSANRMSYGNYSCIICKIGNSSFGNCFPELLKEFNYSKNTVSPYEICKYSHLKIWWKCKNGHEWKSILKHRTLGKHNCPYCCNQKVTENNCLSTKYPYILKEFDFDKNILKPNEIIAGSGRKIWWKCEKNHSWQDRIYNRIKKNPCGCPYCSNKKTNIENCIKTTNPEIIKEWHIKNQISSESITAGSNKKVWWECEKKHEWLQSPHNRIRNGKLIYGCPICRKSKGEMQVSEILKSLNIDFEYQYCTSECKNTNKLPFDFYFIINNIPHIIEYHGRQHYMPIGFGGNPQENFKLLKINDKIKKEYCINGNIKFLEIHYKEKDIKKLIENFIKDNNE